MNHKGSIYLGLLMVIFTGSLLLIGTSITIHQVNQKKVFHSIMGWRALWLGKGLLNHWKVGLAPSEVHEADLFVESHESQLIEGLMSNETEISWREGNQLKKIVLYGYKQVLP